MNGYDNIAGYSLTTGTADVVITDSVASYDPIIGNLSNGAERQYKFQFADPSFSDQYETGVGTWNSGSSTFSRTTVKTSSNGGAKEDFGAGPKVLFIVNDNDAIQSMGTKVETSTAKILTATERTNIAANVALLATRGDTFTLDVGTVSGTVAAGDDSRLGSVDYGDLDPATELDGTEIVAVEQGGDGVQTTVEAIAGNPLTAVRTHAKNRVRGYSAFGNTRPAMIVTTDGALCDLEPWVVLTNAAAGCGVIQAVSAFGIQCFIISLGTTTTGRTAIYHTQYRNVFKPTREMKSTFTFSPSLLPATEALTLQAGFMTGLPALATHGMYFQASAASANYRAIVRDAGVETSSNIDTLIPIAIAAEPPVFHIHYDPDAAATKFYIDGDLVATILNSTRVITTDTVLQMAYNGIKSAGTTAGGFTNLRYHTYDIEAEEVTGFDL